jgi:uncharacterized protein (UPF0335 family)
MDPQKTAFYVKALEDNDAEIVQIRMTAANACKLKRKELKPIMLDAKADGFNPKALTALVAQRKLDLKRKQITQSLDMDQQAQLDQMHENLGQLAGTPLGTSAMKRNGHVEAHA